MSVRAQAVFWGGGVCVFVLLMWTLSDVLAPFAAGLATAYMLDPLVEKLTGRGMKRSLAVGLVCGVFFVVVGGVLAALVPFLVGQAGDFLEAAPGIWERFLEILGSLGWEWDAQEVKEGLAAALQTQGGRDFATGLMEALWSGGGALVGFVSFMVITPVVAAYMLWDWRRLTGWLDKAAPRRHAGTLRRLAGEMNEALSGFVRGQLLVCGLLGVFYATLLGLLGVQFGVLAGLVAGALSFIPFVGALFGGAAAVGLALAQDWPSWGLALWAGGIFILGQTLEGYVLSPWLVGKRVRLHPVWLLFALASFGSVFGFAGLLLATPMAAALGVLARFGMEKYEAGGFYEYAGGEGDKEGGEERGEEGSKGKGEEGDKEG